MGLPERQGLYDPRNEHDACGVSFVVDIRGRSSRAIVSMGIGALFMIPIQGIVLACALAGVVFFGLYPNPLVSLATQAVLPFTVTQTPMKLVYFGANEMGAHVIHCLDAYERQRTRDDTSHG